MERDSGVLVEDFCRIGIIIIFQMDFSILGLVTKRSLEI